jgi:GNAT superfamily N-acetyltransferase
MSLVFSIEPIATCWPDFLDLAKIHWQGTTSYRRHEPFDLSLARYQACNESGFLQFCTARDQSRLVGYLIFYVTTSMHSQLSLAVEDTFFLHPDYRKGRNALRFLQYVERLCREWGISEMMCSCEVDNASGIKGLLTLLDYREVVVQYSKKLANFSPGSDTAIAPTEQRSVEAHTPSI